MTATDADEPNTDNSDIKYKITKQEPFENGLFFINPVNGGLQVNSGGRLDREVGGYVSFCVFGYFCVCAFLSLSKFILVYFTI